MNTKLFTSTGIGYHAKATKDNEGKYISIYVDRELLFSVVKYFRNRGNQILFGKEISELPIYDAELAIEISNHFDQHFNYLNQSQNGND
jgi:hypothetical protein